MHHHTVIMHHVAGHGNGVVSAMMTCIFAEKRNSPMPMRWSGAFLIAVAATLWGSIGVVVALLFQQMPQDPLVVGALRLVIAVPVLWFWHWRVTGQWRIHMPRAHWLIATVGGVAFAGYQVTYFAAIPRIGVAMGVILNICSAPLFTLVLGWLVLGERSTRRQLGAMAVAIAGVVLVVLANNAATPMLNMGAIAAVGAGLCYSSMAVASRRIATAYAPATLLTAMFGVAACILLVCLVGLGRSLVLPTSASWLGVVYLALVPTALSYVLYVRGLQQASATTATTLTLLEPLTSTLCAVMLLAESMVGWAWLGLALAVVSLWVYARPVDSASAG